MAANRVGALYYEAILDPRGFSRGVTKVKAEQDALTSAMKDVTSPIERLQAELDVLNRLYDKIEAKDPFEGQEQSLDAIRKKTALLNKEVQKLKDAPRLQAEKQAAEAREDGLRRAIKKAKELRRVQDDAAKAEKEHSKRMAQLQEQRAGRRLQNWHQYIGSFKGLKILFSDLKNSVGGVSGGLSKMAGNLAQAIGFGPRIQGLARAFGALGIKVLLVVGALVALAKAFTKAAMEADKYELAQIKIIAAMRGNEIRAKRLTEQMRQYAARTSYSTEQMQQFASQLLSLGVVASDIPELAEKLGGLAQGDPERLARVAKAYSDVISKGRLMAQEANQFTENLIPIWEALSANTGKSRAELMEMMEAGKITADMVADALEKASEMVGAEEAMERRQNTIAGQLDQMKSSFAEIWRLLGGPIQNSLVSILKVINFFLAQVEKAAYGFHLIYENCDLTHGILVNTFRVHNNIMKILTGQTAQLEEQARLEGELDDLNRKRKKEEAEIELKQREQLDNFEDMQQDLADQLTALYDRYNEEERLAELQFERMLQEKIALGEITEIQAEQLRMQYQFVEAEKERLALEQQRAEEAERIAEEERRQEEEIEDEYKRELERIEEEARRREEELYKQAEEREQEAENRIRERQRLGQQADAGAGASFEAGSVEEFNMLRQMELQARRDAQQVVFEEEAARARMESNRLLSNMLLELQSETASEVSDALWSYYGI